jgi:hypothetical protein
MKAILLKISAIFLLFVLLEAGCEKKENRNSDEFVGYIAGFDPCSFNHHYKIGYVIISEDLKDTLITYSLSDETFKMPASILSSSHDTLYNIPESDFKNSIGAMFPASTRYKFKIKCTIRYPVEGEYTANLCTNDLFLNYVQIIITSVSK